MNILWRFHEWSEKNIWNMLSKKLMSILLLFFINLVYLGIYISVKGSVLETLGSVGANAEAVRVIASAFDQGLMWSTIVTGVALA